MKRLHLLAYLMIITTLLTGCRTGVVLPGKPSVGLTSTGVNRPSLYIGTPETVTVSPSPTMVLPTSTATPSAPSKPTQTPTLTSEEVHEAVVELMANNGGCQLPCWWGLQPGKTSWQSAHRFLSALDNDIYIAGDPDMTLLAETSIPWNKSTRSEIFIRLVVKNQVVDRIVVRDIDDPSYQLASFLQEQGKPDEVWIHTLASNLGGPPPFSLLLYYKERGFFAQFSSVDTSYEGDKINACINQEPRLILSTPHPEVSFPKFSSSVNEEWGDEWHLILPIEKAMGISVQQFYDRYKSGEQTCFQLTRSLWPEP